MKGDRAEKHLALAERRPMTPVVEEDPVVIQILRLGFSLMPGGRLDLLERELAEY